MHLSGENFLVESGIRDGFLNLCNFVYIFVRIRLGVCLMHIFSIARFWVSVGFCSNIYNQLHMLKGE